MEEQNINNLNETNKPAENAVCRHPAHRMPSVRPLEWHVKLSGCDSRGQAESIILTRPDWNWR